MNFVKNLAIAGIGCALIVVCNARATADEERDAVAEKEAAIRQASKAYIDALKRGDAKALTTHWTEDGMFVDATGRSFNAHKLIEQQFARTNAEPPDRTSIEFDSSIRFVTADVAVEDGTPRSTAAISARETVGRYTAIWVKKRGGWQLDSLREWESPTGSRGGPLDALAWMIGDWIGKGDDLTVKCSAQWSENKNFIVRRFTVERAGRVALGGTQRIGWDAAEGKIRSWVFDSDGGIVEGSWQKEGGAWIVKTKGVLSNGKRTSSLSFWIPEGEDRCVLKSSHVNVGGTEVEEIVVEFTRTSESR